MWFALLLTCIVSYLIHKVLLSKGKKPDWWNKHDIEEIDGSVVASSLEVLLGRKGITERDDYAYKMMGNKKFCGMLESPEPIILVKDVDLLKKILIKDFDNFVDRRDFFAVNNKESLTGRMVGFLKGEEWKGVRNSVSPVFTTGKIRRMMFHFNSVGKEWIQMLQSKSKESGCVTIDVISYLNQYTLEVIASSVFGIKTGTVQNPNSIFSKNARRLTQFSLWQSIKMNLSPRYPKLFKLFGVETLDQTAIKFFEQIVRQRLDARLKGENTGDDFQQLLIEARKGQLKAVGSDELSSFEKDALVAGKAQYLTDEMIIAQSVLFFFAGFSGTTSFLATVLYVLAEHTDVQEKLREEIDQIIKEDGSVDYDDVGKLVYLDMVFNEVFRKYPSTLRIERICTKAYHDPESGLFVPKGAVIGIPVDAIHHDPKHYSNPEEFYPEHFSAENKTKRSPYVFMPFGIGPRNCIGMRFALIESKAVIAHLLHSFRIEPTEKTPLPVESKRIGLFALNPQDLELKLVPLKSE